MIHEPLPMDEQQIHQTLLPLKPTLELKQRSTLTHSPWVFVTKIKSMTFGDISAQWKWGAVSAIPSI